MLFFNVETKSGDSHGSQTASEKVWATNSIQCGDDRKGIRPSGEDGTHVNNVVVSSDGSLILTGDDFGLVNVYSFPGPSIDQSHSYSAHSEHVPRLAFSKDGQYVFSIGGAD